MEIDWNSFQDRIRGYINPVVFIFVFIEMSFLVIVVAIILSVSRVPELNLEVEVSEFRVWSKYRCFWRCGSG